MQVTEGYGGKYRNYSIKPLSLLNPLHLIYPPLNIHFSIGLSLLSPPFTFCKICSFQKITNSLLRVFKFNISNVYFHVSKLDDFFSSSFFKIFIIALDLLLVLNDNCLTYMWLQRYFLVKTVTVLQLSKISSFNISYSVTTG